MENSPDPHVVAIEFELTPEDWTTACASHSWNSELTQKAIRKTRTLFAGAWSVLALMQLLAGSALGALGWAVGGVVWVAMLPSLVRWSHRRQLKKISLHGIANGTFGPHRVELREDGILDSTSGYDWLLKWSAIERIEEADGEFLIYLGPNSFLPIPASAFRDREMLRAFGDRFFQGLAAANDPQVRIEPPG